MPSLVEIGPVALEKKMKMWKVYRQTHGQTIWRTTGDQKCSVKLSAQGANKKAIEHLGANKKFLRVTCKVAIY